MIQHRIMANVRLLQENNCEGGFKNICKMNKKNTCIIYVYHLAV